MKRIGIIYIAAILAVGMLIPSAFAAAGIPSDLTAVPASFDHNIDYERALDEDYKLTTTKNPQIYIDMAQERLFVEAGALAEGKSIVAISYNGGVKWTRIGGIPDSGLDISKALNKGGMFRVTTSLDAKGKGIVTEGDDKSDVYEFPSIDKRPKVERWMVNFSKYADASGATTGQWALTVKNSNDALNLTYQIASSASKKTPDRVYFQNGALYEGTNPETVTGLVPADWGYFKVGEGINIKPMTGTKVTKTTYLIRTAPTKTTPASKVKKVNISGQGKTVKFKADYKKEYIKLKDNARLFAGNLTELVENDTASTVVSYDKESAKTGYVLDDKKTADKYGQTLSIWIGATMKKAATKPLEYNVAARSVMNEKQPTFTASKVSIDTKVFEVYNETKGTWSTTVPKVTEDTTFQIRAKATAKGGKESASTFAASDPGELYVEYGIVDEDKDKSGYTNAYILAPAFDGFLRGRPYKGSVSTPEVDAEITAGGAYQLNFKVMGLRDGDRVYILDDALWDEKSKDITDEDLPPSTGDYAVTPGLFVRPVITGDAVDIDETLSMTVDDTGTVVTINLNAVLPGTSTVGLEFFIRSDYLKPAADAEDADGNPVVPTADQIYFKDETKQSLGVKVTVKALGDVGDITAASSTDADVRLSVTKKAVGSARISDTLTTANVGAMQISQNGKLEITGVTVTDTDGKTKTIANTSLNYMLIDESVLKKIDDATEMIAFANGEYKDPNNNDEPYPFVTIEALGEAKDEQYLVIRYNAVVDGVTAKVLYSFKLNDDVGPQITNVTHASGTGLTVTFDEPLLTSGSGAGFRLENGAIYDGTISGDTVTIIAAASLDYGVYTLIYDGGSGVQDINSNNAVATSRSFSVGGARLPALRSITFDNGYDGKPITIANPPEVTSYSDDSQIQYIALNSSSGKITVNAEGDKVYFGLYASRQTSKPNMGNEIAITNESGSRSVTGYRANDYLYVSAGGSTYCFYITRASAKVTDSAAPKPSSGIVSVSGDTATLTITFDKTMSAMGYGIKASELKINEQLTPQSVRFENGKLTIRLTNSAVEGWNKGSTISVSYNGTGDVDFLMSPGGTKLNGTSFGTFKNFDKNNLPTAPTASPTTSP